MGTKLTPKQRAFVDLYLANGFNASRAARDAGYSEKTARAIGAENLTKPDIRVLIDKRLRDLAMSAEEALFRLSQHARSDMADFVDARGRIDVAAAGRAGKLHLIKKLTIDPESGKAAVELYDAQSALVHILREQHLSAGEPTETSEVVVLNNAERVRRINEILDAARARRDGRAADDGSNEDAGGE